MLNGCSIALRESPSLLFFCIAKACILDKSPISDQGTRCCSHKLEDGTCSCSPPSFSPSQRALWLLAHGFTCCHEQAGTPNIPLLWIANGHRKPSNLAAHVRQSQLSASRAAALQASWLLHTTPRLDGAVGVGTLEASSV